MSSESDQASTVSFHYIKSNYFRVIHVDGAIIGSTASGKLHISFYSERPSIARQTTHKLDPDGRLGELLDSETVTRGGYVREIDVDAIIDINTAKKLCNLLTESIEESESWRNEVTSRCAKDE